MHTAQHLNELYARQKALSEEAHRLFDANELCDESHPQHAARRAASEAWDAYSTAAKEPHEHDFGPADECRHCAYCPLMPFTAPDWMA